MGIAGVFYRAIGRRFSTTLAATAGGVFFLDLLINKGGDAIWDSVSCFSKIGKKSRLKFAVMDRSNFTISLDLMMFEF